VASTVLLAVGIIAIGFAPSVGWVLPGAVLVGMMNGLLNVTLASLVMGRTLAAERGRIGALLTGVASGMQILAFAMGGALAEVFAPRQIFVAAGVLGVLVPLALGRGLLRSATAASSALTPAPAFAA
jgi:MFS family permease